MCDGFFQLRKFAYLCLSFFLFLFKTSDDGVEVGKLDTCHVHSQLSVFKFQLV